MILLANPFSLVYYQFFFYLSSLFQFKSTLNLSKHQLDLFKGSHSLFRHFLSLMKRAGIELQMISNTWEINRNSKIVWALVFRTHTKSLSFTLSLSLSLSLFLCLSIEGDTLIHEWPGKFPPVIVCV